jgi:hypothetical protein
MMLRDANILLLLANSKHARKADVIPLLDVFTGIRFVTIMTLVLKILVGQPLVYFKVKMVRKEENSRIMDVALFQKNVTIILLVLQKFVIPPVETAYTLKSHVMTMMLVLMMHVMMLTDVTILLLFVMITMLALKTLVILLVDVNTPLFLVMTMMLALMTVAIRTLDVNILV